MMTVDRAKRSKPVTLGRSGRDADANSKELTIVMVPYDRFSPFPRAIDDLYRSSSIPFNLIVIEGNAPDCVRLALERRQRRYQNITIIYSRHRPSISGSFNLAIPHIKTPFAFFMDNGIRVPAGTLERLIDDAKKSVSTIVCPTCEFGGDGNLPVRGILEEILPEGNAALHSCFLITEEALQKIGRFDEDVNPFTAYLDITLRARQQGIAVCTESKARLECLDEGPLQHQDARLYSFQWGKRRANRCLRHIQEKWGITISERDLMNWFEVKRRRPYVERQTTFSEMVTRLSQKLGHAGKTATGFLGSLPLGNSKSTNPL